MRKNEAERKIAAVYEKLLGTGLTGHGLVRVGRLNEAASWFLFLDMHHPAFILPRRQPKASSTFLSPW